MVDAENEVTQQTQEQAAPRFEWEDYWAGSGRAPFEGGYYLAIPSAGMWVARYDVGGKTTWQHPVPFNTADEAQAECERHSRTR